MRELEEKILSEGKVFPGNVLKVSNFLNHRIDIAFSNRMGEEIARLFEKEKITKVFTIEASGIALAFAAGLHLNCPMVFAKKNTTSNLQADLYSTMVHSFTHNKDYCVVVSKEVLKAEDRILIIDDFLANGEALNGLIDLCHQAGATVAGCCVAIEKCFQGGGDALRAKGIRVEALAGIESMSDTSITFRK